MTVDLDAFDVYYADAKAEVDDHIDVLLADHEDEAELRKLFHHATSGGKRVRPVLTLLMADAVGCPRDRALNHAAIVELLHNATLVADDWHDGDEMRRGMPTLWKVVEKIPWVGPDEFNPKTLLILYQNGLLSLALEIVRSDGVTRAMGEGVRACFKGFYKEGRRMAGGAWSGGYDKYIEVNKLKTGSLFALSTWMPAIIAPVDRETEEAARKYGEHIGILYQIADDIADGDLPSVVTDREAELEKWHENALTEIDALPVDDPDVDVLLRAAPAWGVNAMFEQESVALEPAFLHQTHDTTP